MRLLRAVRLSRQALMAHRVRTSLVLTSVAVGVAGVLLTGALGRGADQEVQRGLEAAGSNLLVIRPADVRRSAARPTLRGTVRTLRLDDYEAITALPLVAAAAPGADGGARLVAAGGSMAASVLGTSPALARIRNLRIASGRFLEDEDDRSASRVAVLGARVARMMFPGQDPVGCELRLRATPFVVVGVLEAKGISSDGSDQDGTVYVPVRTAMRRVFNTVALSAVFVAVEDRARMDDAAAALRRALRERHLTRAGAGDDFAVQNQVRLLLMQRRAVASLTLLTGGLAGVALLLAGSGILALMFLSVKERTGEIGLRMAVGARPRDILLQFLGEAALLAGGGWVLGALLASLGAVALARATDWRIAFPTGGMVASLVMALATGVGFGALPARKAALLPPIRALHTGS